MEKFDSDDLLEEFSSDETLNLDVPEDNEYAPSLAEERAFLTDTVGPEAAEEAVPYGQLPDREWPVYTYETKGGKGIAVKHDAMGTLWHVEFVPGGQLPKELSGKFTSDNNAKHAVEQYLAKQEG